jgi:putative addiction module component (TIGR02574 family)
MKPIELPLAQMTVSEKLHVIETIWEDLARDESQVESPDWHSRELHDREQRLQAGTESVLDWETAKAELRKRHP